MSTEAVAPTCLFLVAENRLLRDAVQQIFDGRGDIHVVSSASLSPETVARLTELAPQVLLLDASVFAASKVERMQAIRQATPKTKIVMVGMDEEEETFLLAIRANIAGYVLKEASARDLAAAVHSVLNGEAVCPPKLCLTLFGYVARRCNQSSTFYGRLEFDLTRREQELIPMMDRGLTNKEIAGALNLSEQTIKTHIHRILQKLRVSDRLAAAEVCRLHGLAK
jgi:DNA-binding NarL/FixJ family response regulator